MSEVKVNKINTRTNTALTIQQNSTTAMTIDTSQNVFVKTTGTGTNIGVDSSSTGFYLRDGGQLRVARDNSQPILANRLNGDGVIIDCRKDGTTVGSVVAESGDLIVGNGDTALRYNDALNAIYPANASTGASLDNTLNLGWSSVKWANLYMGGNIYLGGTGSANALDDYEEGTFTPSFSNFTGTVSNADYTKIGNIVHVQMYISSISGGSGADAEITNLPFTCDTNGWSPFIVNGQFSGVGFTYQVLGRVEGGTSKLSFKNNNDNNIHGSDIDSSSFMTMQFTYKTN